MSIFNQFGIQVNRVRVISAFSSVDNTRTWVEQGDGECSKKTLLPGSNKPSTRSNATMSVCGNHGFTNPILPTPGIDENLVLDQDFIRTKPLKIATKTLCYKSCVTTR